MSSGERWRDGVADHPDRYNWLGGAQEIITSRRLPIPKPGKRITDLFHNGGSGRDKCSREGMCRMCRRSWRVRPLTRHHLVPLRWFMWSKRGQHFRAVRNANANIVPLCWPCHKLIEDEDEIARHMLRQLLTQKEVAYAVRLRGIQWLDQHYPYR